MPLSDSAGARLHLANQAAFAQRPNRTTRQRNAVARLPSATRLRYGQSLQIAHRPNLEVGDEVVEA